MLASGLEGDESRTAELRAQGSGRAGGPEGEQEFRAPSWTRHLSVFELLASPLSAHCPRQSQEILIASHGWGR